MGNLDFDNLNRKQKRKKTHKHNLANWYFKFNAQKRKHRLGFLKTKQFPCPTCKQKLIIPLVETQCIDCRKASVVV